MKPRKIRALHEALQCPICWEILDTPTTLPCGHSYCSDCIEGAVHAMDAWQCPLCKKYFCLEAIKLNYTLHNACCAIKSKPGIKIPLCKKVSDRRTLTRIYQALLYLPAQLDTLSLIFKVYNIVLLILLIIAGVAAGVVSCVGLARAYPHHDHVADNGEHKNNPPRGE